MTGNAPHLPPQDATQTMPARLLVTGVAGFIGFHLARRLLDQGCAVLGIDNLSPYYDVGLKQARLEALTGAPGFQFLKLDIADAAGLEAAWAGFSPQVTVHLAAQAGVRHSVDYPETYVSSNLVGAFNVLETARRHPVAHLLCASTSSVYGANRSMPFRETDRAALPLSLYAATKASGELMGHAYAHLFGTPTTFFRFFTVYGPWGRPDMAAFKFARAILAGQPIDLYNAGEMTRDFTYIDDLIEALVRLIPLAPTGAPVEGDSLSPVAPFRALNIGGGAPVALLDFVSELETALGRAAIRNPLPMQQGDVPDTSASLELLQQLIGFRPATPIREGVRAFVDWYRAHYSV